MYTYEMGGARVWAGRVGWARAILPSLGRGSVGAKDGEDFSRSGPVQRGGLGKLVLPM